MIVKSHSTKSTPPKLAPIPDGVAVSDGTRISSAVKGIASGTAYSRSVSLQDKLPSASSRY